jgi:hypothetical protein
MSSPTADDLEWHALSSSPSSGVMAGLVLAIPIHE